jgi:hypothetical protein
MKTEKMTITLPFDEYQHLKNMADNWYEKPPKIMLRQIRYSSPFSGIQSELCVFYTESLAMDRIKDEIDDLQKQIKTKDDEILKKEMQSFKYKVLVDKIKHNWLLRLLIGRRILLYCK